MKLALALLMILGSVNAEAQSRNGSRGGVSSEQARASSSATSDQSSDLNDGPRRTNVPAEGSMRRNRNGFGAQAALPQMGGVVNSYSRNGETVAKLTTESNGDRHGLKLNIEGIVASDRDALLAALKTQMQNSLTIRAHVTFMASSENPNLILRNGAPASSFRISTGMRHPMTLQESLALFVAADRSLQALLENVTVSVDYVVDEAPARRF